MINVQAPSISPSDVSDDASVVSRTRGIIPSQCFTALSVFCSIKGSSSFIFAPENRRTKLVTYFAHVAEEAGSQDRRCMECRYIVKIQTSASAEEERGFEFQVQ